MTVSDTIAAVAYSIIHTYVPGFELTEPWFKRNEHILRTPKGLTVYLSIGVSQLPRESPKEYFRRRPRSRSPSCNNNSKSSTSIILTSSLSQSPPFRYYVVVLPRMQQAGLRDFWGSWSFRTTILLVRRSLSLTRAPKKTFRKRQTDRDTQSATAIRTVTGNNP